MSEQNNGGPAFPAPAGVGHITEQGMTLRDYFAAKALTGLLTHPASDLHGEKELALQAFNLADAMLKARQN